jgi:hypothetical protein
LADLSADRSAFFAVPENKVCATWQRAQLLTLDFLANNRSLCVVSVLLYHCANRTTEIAYLH